MRRPNLTLPSSLSQQPAFHAEPRAGRPPAAGRGGGRLWAHPARVRAPAQTPSVLLTPSRSPSPSCGRTRRRSRPPRRGSWRPWRPSSWRHLSAMSCRWAHRAQQTRPQANQACGRGFCAGSPPDHRPAAATPPPACHPACAAERRPDGRCDHQRHNGPGRGTARALELLQGCFPADDDPCWQARAAGGAAWLGVQLGWPLPTAQLVEPWLAFNSAQNHTAAGEGPPAAEL